MTEEVLCCGFGGQGIMLMGRLLALAANLENKFITWLPAYGAEVRGGTAYCMVKISDEAIASPIVNSPSVCIAMNEPSFKKYSGAVRKNGLLIVNSSLVNIKSDRQDIRVLYVPCTEIAKELGNVRVANMVALAGYLAASRIVKIESLKKALKEEAVANYRENLLAVNEQAIVRGLSFGKND
ncbi:MAG: 2-oxoacid:acceptor oxidoreductase family protein [Candidatus Omnitrophota bacterium]